MRGLDSTRLCWIASLCRTDPPVDADMLREVTEMGNFLSAGLLFAGATVDPAVRMTARFLTEEREETRRWERK